MSDPILHVPMPILDGPHQPGVTDPVWPSDPPPGVDLTKYRDLYAGQIERQRHLHIVTANVLATSRAELVQTLKDLSDFASHEMRRPPPGPERPYDGAVANRRVTITIGFGSRLFTTAQGDDRFGLAGLRPSSLKIIPQISGDSEFVPRDVACDLIFLLASDDVYVNEYLLGLLHYQKKGIKIQKVERGYARPDSREPSGFEDGVTNPKDLKPISDLNRFVYITATDDEPAWCVGGTYLAYRKIRRRLARFFALENPDREAVFGVHRKTGLRLEQAGPDAHAQKMNPQREGHQDLFGIEDNERHILRRPYFFDDGFDTQGEELRGVHHVSFARDLIKQYEWPVLMWQTNPDFPSKGAGQDRLYGVGGAANVSAGYYFIPRAPRTGGFTGEGLF